MAQKFGHINSVAEGQVFPTREALANAGLHRSHQKGIDGNSNEGVSAIVISGGFIDNKDFGYVLHYTGEGGNDPLTGRQIRDQTISSAGNAGLLVSMKKNFPLELYDPISITLHFLQNQDTDLMDYFLLKIIQ